MSIPTWDGQAIFGLAARVQDRPKARARQELGFFGSDGLAHVDAGSRGRSLTVEGVLTGAGLEDLLEAETALLTALNGAGDHVLTDGSGRAFSGVIFEGLYYPAPGGPVWTGQGVACLPYSVELMGLI